MLRAIYRLSPACLHSLLTVVLLLFSLPVSVAAQSIPPGELFAWGYNNDGELGNGKFTGYPYHAIAVPAVVPGLTNVKAIAANWTSMALTSDGQIYAWGYNEHGELGNGLFTDTPVPAVVPGLPKIKAIAAGLASLALTEDGQVYAWGPNNTGELGNGTFTTAAPYGIAVPAIVPGLPKIKAIAAGGASLALTEDGQVYAWGLNEYGELGNGKFTGPPYNGIATPKVVPGLTNVTAIAASSSHCLALTSDGQVYAWGDNRYGELGNGSFTNTSPYGIAVPAIVPGLPKIKAIAAGSGDSMVLTEDGHVYAWGYNDYGQLGNGSFAHPRIFTPQVVPGLTNVKAIAAARDHSMALTSDGKVYAWGYSNYGQLGNGVLGGSSIVVPEMMPGLTNVKAIAAGWYFSLALNNIFSGIDLSTSAFIGLPTFQKWKKEGLDVLVVDCWRGHNANLSASAYFIRARYVGMKTAGYCELSYDNPGQTGTWQVEQALAAAGSEARYLSFMAIACEPSPQYNFLGNSTSAQRIQRIAEAVQAVQRAGLQPVIYTRNIPESPDQCYWDIITGQIDHYQANVPYAVVGSGIGSAPNNPPNPFNNLPLWTSRNDSLSDLEFDKDQNTLWPTFGSWTNRQGKQYQSSQTLDGVAAGLDVLDVALFPSTPNAYLLLTDVLFTPVASSPGVKVTLSAHLGSIVANVANLTGRTLNFSIDGSPVGSAATDATGWAKVAYTIPSNADLGARTVTVKYDGDATYAGDTATGSLLVQKGSIYLTVGYEAGKVGQTVPLRALLRRIPDGLLLSGKTVTFKVDGVTVGTAVSGSNGLASYTYTISTETSTGSHTITVNFAGDSDYNAASATNTLTINP